MSLHWLFCLGTGVPRHSAEAYICCTYVVCIICHVHARVMKAEKSTIYTSVNIFIALGWCSESDYGLLIRKYAYQDCEYIIRTMNTKHTHCTCYIFSIQHQNLYILLFLLQAACMIALCSSEHICDQVA